MTSIFFPFSAGWMLLSRVYCLPSTKSAELALEKASTASVPTMVVDGKFLTSSDRIGGHGAVPAALDALVAKARAERARS